MTKKEVIEFLKTVNLHYDDSKKIKQVIKAVFNYIDKLERENKILTHTNKSYKGIINKQNTQIANSISKDKIEEKI